MARSNTKTSVPVGDRRAGGLRATFDRWVVTLGLFVVAAASAVVFLVATGVLSGEQVIADEALRIRALGFAEGTYRVATAVGSLVVGLGTTLLALRRLSGGAVAETAGTHVLLADERGWVMVDSAAIAALAENAVIRTPAVMDARVRVRGRGSGPVRARVALTVLAGTDLKRTGREARENVRRAIEELGGLDVHDVVVQLDVVRPDELEVT